MSGMFGSLGSLVVSITTDLSSFNAGLKEANAKVQRASGEILRATSQIGRQMTVMGAAITGGLGLAVKSSIDFEDAFAGVRKTVDASEEEFGQISSQFRQLAKEIPITAVEFSKIGEIAGQLGIRGVDDITKFSKTISLIGVTTNLSTEEAATSFARIANVMKEPIQNVDRLGAAIVDLGNNYAANEVEITNFSNRIASAGKIIGMTTSDILGIGAAFTSVGVPAEAGGTAVQKVMNAITQAAAEGGEKLEIFAQVTGMTTDEFKKLKEEDPAEAFTQFVEGLGTAGDEAFVVLEELGLQNERVIRAFLSMASSSDTLRSAISTASDAWEENLALQIEADKRFATTASQLKILMNNIVELGRQIGDALLPALKPMLEGFKQWIQKVGDFVSKHPSLTAAIAKIVAGFGLLMLTLGPILIVLPGLVTSFTLLGPALTSLSAGVTALASAVLGLKVSLAGLAGIAAAAFAGWKIGRLIGEVTGLDEALSGENGLFTKMWEWAIKNEEKLKSILRIMQAIASFGVSEALGLGIKMGQGVGPATAEAAEINSGGELGDVVNLGTMEISAASGELSKLTEQSNTFFADFTKSIKTTLDGTKTLGAQVGDLIVNQAQSMSMQFGSAFASMIVRGKDFGETMKQMFLDMMEMFISAVTQMIAKWLVFTALTAAFGGGGGGGFWGFLGFHKGGMVMHKGGFLRAHDGMSLASDEIPIIAQTGEGILSRKGMEGLGGPSVLEALNSGALLGSSPNINITVNATIDNTMDIADLAEELGGFIKQELSTA